MLVDFRLAFLLASESPIILVLKYLMPGTADSTVGNRRGSPEVVGFRVQGSGLRALSALSSPADPIVLRVGYCGNHPVIKM